MNQTWKTEGNDVLATNSKGGTFIGILIYGAYSTHIEYLPPHEAEQYVIRDGKVWLS